MESTLQIEENGKIAKKLQRVKNSSYPSYTVENCVKLTTRIDAEFSNINYIPSKDISETVQLSGGAFLQQLSSCVQYGLLELKHGEGYKPTLLFEKIKKPLPTENINDALIECFQLPPLYKKLINDFREKQLPSEKGLANTLDRTYGLKGNASNLAARIFLKNAQTLGLIASGNILKLDASYIPFEETDTEEKNDTIEIEEKPEQTALLISPEKNASSEQIKKPNIKTREIPVFLQGENREAKLVLPIDFTEDDIKRIVRVLNAYFP